MNVNRFEVLGAVDQLVSAGEEGTLESDSPKKQGRKAEGPAVMVVVVERRPARASVERVELCWEESSRSHRRGRRVEQAVAVSVAGLQAQPLLEWHPSTEPWRS